MPLVGKRLMRRKFVPTLLPFLFPPQLVNTRGGVVIKVCLRTPLRGTPALASPFSRFHRDPGFSISFVNTIPCSFLLSLLLGVARPAVRWIASATATAHKVLRCRSFGKSFHGTSWALSVTLRSSSESVVKRFLS